MNANTKPLPIAVHEPCIPSQHPIHIAIAVRASARHLSNAMPHHRPSHHHLAKQHQTAKRITQLAGLVHDQGLQMERIDADIADTQHNVEEAHKEIAKYFHSITTNRMLILKTFATLIALFALFMMFK